MGRSSAWCRMVAPCSFYAVDTAPLRSTTIFLLQPGSKKGSEVLNSSQERLRSESFAACFSWPFFTLGAMEVWTLSEGKGEKEEEEADERIKMRFGP